LCGSESKLALVVWTKIRPTCTTKNTKGRVIWFNMEKAMNWSVIVDSSTRKHINEISGSQEGFIPKFKRHMSVSKKGKAYFNYMAMFALSGAILLMCMRT
jgi:hypothetical protein